MGAEINLVKYQSSRCINSERCPMTDADLLGVALERKCQLAKYKFNPFAPIDNSNSEKHSSDVLLGRNQQLLTDLLKMTFIEYFRLVILFIQYSFYFLPSHWMHNETLQKFIVSYLMFRSRPLDVPEENAPNLFSFDQLVSS
jgi:hypothetical protein